MDLVTVTPRLPEPGETVTATRFLTYPGGKGANQAVAAARLGADVSLIGRVGDDAFGREVLKSFGHTGVDVSGVAIDTHYSTGMAAIAIEENSGQNRIIAVPGANQALDDTERERAKTALAATRLLMLQLEVSLEVTLELARYAHERGCTVMLDPAPAPANPILPEVYRYIDVITPNETEAQAQVGFPVVDERSALQAAKVLHERGPWLAVVTLGERGAAYASQEGQGHLPPFSVTAVDTVAAGDAFNGALAVALSENRPLQEALRWGMAAGALAVTRHGAQEAMPTREEVERQIGEA